MALIIGLTGRRRVGKDTVAAYLRAGHGFTQIAVADPLKRAAAEIFSFTDEQLNGATKEVLDPRWGISPREILQFVGTDLFRNAFGAKYPAIGPNIWATSLAVRIGDLKHTSPRIVISDVRFANEAEAVSRSGGIIIRITRDLPLNGTTDTHASEVGEGIRADYTIPNNGSLPYLFAQIDHIIAERIAK
jgi:hypothetical protein